MIEIENKYLENRKPRCTARSNDTVGIAFSGGGIRSACFALGVLKHIEESGKWNKIDYVSSVSGGGYAAASFISSIKNNPEKKDNAESIINTISNNQGYLNPSHLQILAIPLLGIVSAFLTLSYPALIAIHAQLTLNNPNAIALWTSVSFLAFMAALKLIGKGIPSIVTGLSILPTALLLNYLLLDNSAGLLIISLLFILCMVLLNIRSESLIIRPYQRILKYFIFILAIVAFNKVLNYYSHEINRDLFFYGYVFILFAYIFSLIISPNALNSLNEIYEKSLRESFGKDLDIHVSAIKENTSLPIFIINCLAQSSETKGGGVNFGGSNFSISQLFVGSKGNGFFHTNSWQMKNGGKRHQNLWSLVATSGAAIDWNPSKKSPLINSLMSIANFGIGKWIINPATSKENRNLYPNYFLNFLSAIGVCKDTSKWIRISDGGHFENLGLYELVSRKCKTIIVVDAGFDPQTSYDDLARATQLCKNDFGATIEIPTLNIENNDEVLKKSIYFGEVKYDDSDATSDLIYIKLNVSKENSLQLRLRKSIDSKFPHEPTANQKIDVNFIRAYSLLGYETAKNALKNKLLQSE